MRIISTVPSLTELLSYLGLDDELVGITKFCIHPDHVYRSKPRVGGTKDLHLNAIRALNPDVIIANKEENTREQIEVLQASHEVLLTDIKDLDTALDAILTIGRHTDREDQAEALSEEIESRFKQLRPCHKHSVLYLIWQAPYMSIGHDTFIHDMINRCGFESVTSHLSRYPELSPSEYNPDLILLSSEPFPFKDKHVADIQSAWPKAKVRLVNGEYFSWYGSRLLEAPVYFKRLMD